uniref:phage portal protein n=1 Tax=Pseudomonas aeruginosa TaxID=287 RepID=UPI0035BBE41F
MRGYNQLNRIQADQVLHIFEPLECGQLRGVPRLSPVLLRLKSLDNYEDAVLIMQAVSHLFAGFITRPRQDGAPIFDPSTGLARAQDRDG